MTQEKKRFLQTVFDKSADKADAVFDHAGDIADKVKEHHSEYLAIAVDVALSAPAVPFLAAAEAVKIAAKAARKPLAHTNRF